MNELNRQLPDRNTPLYQPIGYRPPIQQEEREVHLRDYWKVILKRRWTILAFFSIVVATTAVATFTMKPIYRATTTIQIDPQIVDFKRMDMDYYQTQYKILESKSLARRVIQTLNLQENPLFFPDNETPSQQSKPNLLHSISGLFGPERNLSETEKEGFLVDWFLKRRKVEPIRNSRLVKVHFDSNDPELSSQVANELARAFIHQNLETRFYTTEQEREWLTKQLEELKAKVERSDETLVAFGSKHGIISLEEKENVMAQRLNELNEALTKAEVDRIGKEALYSQTKGANADSFTSILENKLIMDLKQALIQLEGQYMKLAETFKPEDPEMIKLRTQMKTIREGLEVETQRIINGIRNEYEASLLREKLLRESFEAQKKRVMEMKVKAIQYNILKQEADTNKDLYWGLLQRMKEAELSAEVMANNIQIVDWADRPIKPFRPNKRLNLLLAVVVGLFLSVGLAFFIEYLDNTVKTPADVEQLIQLPTFGMVPEVSQHRRKRLEQGRASPIELITHLHPKSMLSEAYRNIRTSILLSFSERPPRRIAITSPNPGEGKTTTAINTAIALSRTGTRVILIDAHLRKPRLHKVFTGDNELGLSNFLSGNIGLEAIIKKTDIPNLFYIPSGPILPNPSELIGSNLFKEMVQILEGQFEHIVFDSPPVLGFADSVILSTVVDGMVFVVVSGKTPRETLQQANEMLHQVNAKILGVIINRVNIERSEYGYYYYRYHYYDGKEGKRKKELPYYSDDEASPASTT